MFYDTDTLTSAKSNREASQKFYNFVMAPARTLLPHEIPQMLHRSPSGAKRKIRQRREEHGSRPSPFLAPSPSSSSTTSSTSTMTSTTTMSSSPPSSSPTPADDGHYRKLIDSGDYRSILPDFQPAVAPVPPPRLSIPFSSSMSSLELSSLPPAKPTVEVHPMPSEERSSPNGSVDMDVLKQKPKPAVPAKPKGLLIDHLNRSTSMTSLASPVSQTTSTFLNTFVPTPSLINLQQGYRNSDHLDSQELARLENTRQESIQKVSRHLTTYEEEKGFIENELEEIERAGARLLAIVERHDKILAGKIRRHLENSRELVHVETKLRLQFAKLDDAVRNDVIDKTTAVYEESRLRRRFQETDFLRNIYARREKDHIKELSSLLGNDELARWRRYRQASTKLLEDDDTVDYRIHESRMKLDALSLAPRSN